MLLCGIDLGTSAIKFSVVDAANQKLIFTCSFPDIENEIYSPELGFAEQDPEHWWYCVKQAIIIGNSSGKYNPKDISAIGISYQMHGLVVLNAENKVLRNSIIWCDSRATGIGEKAFNDIGNQNCQSNLLNSPGNFTASKLAWVKQNQPHIYDQIDKVLLPGDYISGCLCHSYTTSSSALSEGIFWDFNQHGLSNDILTYFGFSKDLFPKIKPVFSSHGQIDKQIAHELGLNDQVEVTYKAGDQPNNAFSLGVLEPGEIATTAGTSGVMYGVSASLKFDPQNRVNSFAHVNHTNESIRIGVLMCINGTGILNRWLKQNFFSNLSYPEMNALGAKSPIGSNGLICNPFGNGSERIFNNKTIGGSWHNLDFNRHSNADMIRSSQEGIAFAMVYGLELLETTGIKPTHLKAGLANMYLSDIFSNAIVNASHVGLELMESDGAYGAALGAGVGLGYYHTPNEAVNKIKRIKEVHPSKDTNDQTQEAYALWKENLHKLI